MRRQHGSGENEFFKRDPARSWWVKHGAIFNTALRRRDVPLLGSGSKKHFACGRSSFAQVRVGSAHAEAAARKLVAVFGIQVSLGDSNAPPIAVEFFSHHHRQRSANTLTDF